MLRAIWVAVYYVAVRHYHAAGTTKLLGHSREIL
jgi:hypothetical protein